MNNDLGSMNSLSVENKLSTMLAVIISFQQKVQSLKT